MSGTGNIFAGVMPNPTMEIFTTLLAEPGLRIERVARPMAELTAERRH